MLICPLFVLTCRFESTIVVVLFGVLRSVLAMVGVNLKICMLMGKYITYRLPSSLFDPLNVFVEFCILAS